MVKYLRYKGTVPRWFIMLLDLLIVTGSFACSYFLIYRFEFINILRGYFFIYTGSYFIVSALVMFSTRIHTGLIRYSSMRDVMRIFSTVFLSAVIYLLLMHAWIIPTFHFHGVAISKIIIVNCFVSSASLIMVRTAIKGGYFYINSISQNKKTKVLVYGSDYKAMLVKQALITNDNEGFEVIGFVDSDPGMINREIQHTRVYDINSLEKLKNKHNVEKLVMTSNQLNEKGKRSVLDKCLSLGIHVLTVPPSEQWLSEKLNPSQIKDLNIEDLLQRKPIQIDTTKISRDLRNSRVLVTGAAGSIGSEIVNQVLTYKPALLILCDQAESALYDIQLEITEKFPDVRIVIFIADVRNYERMNRLFYNYKPQTVFHAAAYKHVPMMEDNPTEAVMTNILGTRHVADLSVKYGVSKFVMISTDKAVNPSNVMGTSKRIAEMYIQSLKTISDTESANTRFITTRFGNVLGSNGSVIPRFRAQIDKGGPLTVTHPEITRYFMTIPEAVQLVLEAAAMGIGGEIYIFDMGEPVKIVDLAHNMIRLAGLQPGKDIEVVFTGLRPGEKLYEELLNDGESTLPTHQEKIKIAKVIICSYEKISQNIDELLLLTRLNNDAVLVNKMKEIVPEFISKNSPFEDLDKVALTIPEDAVFQLMDK